MFAGLIFFTNDNIMELQDINELKPVEELAVIININTRISTTLALMSSLRYVKMPVLVIDCGSKDRSYEYFLELMKSYEFDLLSAPLHEHGKTLDWIFMNVNSEKILLIDSDLEILEDIPIKMMREAVMPGDIFGSGFIHEGAWMLKHKMKYGYYEERAWVPFVLLKVKIVREALGRGLSFCAKKAFNDLPRSQFFSKLLAGRLYLPILRNLKLSFLDHFRKEFHGVKPSLLYYDTGALMYQHLRDSCDYRFAGLSWEINWKHIIHFHGVTRLQLNSLGRNGVKLNSISDYIKQRLIEKYELGPDDA